MRKILVGSILVGLLVVLVGSPAKESAAFPAGVCGYEKFGFSVACVLPVHNWLNGAALWFLDGGDDSLLEFLNEQSKDQDQFDHWCIDGPCGGNYDDGKRHFDHCGFTRSTDYIYGEYAQAIDAFDPENASFDWNAGWAAFGRLLHTVQDFYAHTNWVEIASDRPDKYAAPGLQWEDLGIFERGLGFWKDYGPGWNPLAEPNDDIYIFQNNNYVDPLEADADPPGWLYNEGSHLPEMAVAIEGSNEQKDMYVLIGTGDDSYCYDTLAIDHSDWNHDGPSGLIPLAEPTVYDLRALSFATWQTQHEWCRLLNLGGALTNYRASSYVLAWGPTWNSNPPVSPADVTASLAGTACGPEEPGPIDVTVQPANITIGSKPDAPSHAGADSLQFLLYTGDFRRWDRSIIRLTGPEGQSAVPEGQSVPAADLPGPLHLCVDAGDDLVMSVQTIGEDRNVPGARYPRGVTLNIPHENLTQATGSWQASSGNLDAAFNVDIGRGADSDGDGLGECAENYYGFSASEKDSNGDTILDGDEDPDGDGLSMEEELYTYHTDPWDWDPDRDGLSDKDELALGTDPWKGDTDGDKVSDGPEDPDGTGPIVAGPDNCPLKDNLQTDTDGDGKGDACDADNDNDGVPDTVDNCAWDPNPDQLNTDHDTMGNVCDGDDDNDFVCTPGEADPLCWGSDNCPLVPNGFLQKDLLGVGNQTDNDEDGLGDACDPDDDNDGFCDPGETDPSSCTGSDNCQWVFNRSQHDTDGDGGGDACDTDVDGDGVANAVDSDDDNDQVLDTVDNCPLVPNGPLEANPPGVGNQTDSDQDGLKDDDGDYTPSPFGVCTGGALGCDEDQLDGADNDGDGKLDEDGGGGDACDLDDDNDWIADSVDVEPPYPLARRSFSDAALGGMTHGNIWRPGEVIAAVIDSTLPEEGVRIMGHGLPESNPTVIRDGCPRAFPHVHLPFFSVHSGDDVVLTCEPQQQWMTIRWRVGAALDSSHFIMANPPLSEGVVPHVPPYFEGSVRPYTEMMIVELGPSAIEFRNSPESKGSITVYGFDIPPGGIERDDDGDDCFTSQEIHVGTNAYDARSHPLDIDGDGDFSVTGDVINYVGSIGATPSAQNWWQRLDLDMSGDIDVTGDVAMYIGRIGELCR